MRCADKTLLAAWVDGELEAADERAVAEHAGHCHRCAADAREQRLVKWRTAHLSAEAPLAPRPDLLHQLLTVPSMEYSRQSQARRACGAGPTRWAGIAVGAGVGVSMATVAWLAPMSPSGVAPTGARVDSPSSVVPVGIPSSSTYSPPFSSSGSSSALSPGVSSGPSLAPSLGPSLGPALAPSLAPSLGGVPVGATRGQHTGPQLAVSRSPGDAR